MKVLHLVKTSVGAHWAFREMRELVKLGVEVHVAMPVDGPLVKEYVEKGITVHNVTYSLAHFISSAFRIKEIVQEVKPDIVHSHFVLTTLIMRFALRNNHISRIFQVPGPLHLENCFFRNLDICTANKDDYWVGSCKWTNKRYHMSGIPENRLFLSYYGSDIKYNEQIAPGKIRTELDLGNQDIIVGMVAYMYAPKRFLGQKRGLKGHEDFIDAIALVSREYPNVYGVCVGGAWNGAKAYESQVKKYAQRKTDHVYFLGSRSDIPELYADMFCVVHPSLSENLGAAGESLLLGIPTISTDVGGFPDIVINGETGLLVPPHNPLRLAEAIIDLIEMKYDLNKLSTSGKILVSEMLDIKNTARSVFEIYQKISG